MIYKLKNDNYKNFKIYKENVLQPRSYFIPFNSGEEMAGSDIRNERYSSSMVGVLSGEWDFAYFKKASDIPDEFDTAAFPFDKVTVPSCWQFTGYEPPYYLNTRYQFQPAPPAIPEDCSVGVYRKRFAVEETDANYTLSFLGVAGALDVFVNGKYVGYSEGSHNTAEFELNEFLTEGANELVAVVHKFSNGTYLEAQDMFRNNGIFRDVLLTKTGNNSLYDFEVRTPYSDGTYRLTILPSLKLVDECVLTANLLYDGEVMASKSVNVSAEMIDIIDFSALEVKEWSAEEPNLYTLLLSLSKEGRLVEAVRKNIGFKHIEIKGNVFYFNNQNIKLFGVNHHDTDPKKGYVMTVDEMERDIRLFKEYNVNCVRTSHYPPDPIFLDLCDEYGIYVIDEADIETHGCLTELHRPRACSHNKVWQPRYWDRVYRMFERDKNHPSITMWSLGNESWGYLNQDYCYGELKKRSDIPIHYENVIHTRRFAYDVISQMYPWQSKVRKVAAGKGLKKKWYKKPYFLCEYAHAMGLGAGELNTYVDLFLSADNMLGGCIWEFADHAVYHENGKYQYTYGGDHGEEKHDGNFCVDGLFFPDRLPHTGALQMKNCYRPVRAETTETGEYCFKNFQCFVNAHYTVQWNTIGADGRSVHSGAFELDIPPKGSQTITIESNEIDAVIFRYYDGDFEVASEQLDIYSYDGVTKTVAVSNTAPVADVNGNKLNVKFEGGEVVFDLETARLISYHKNGKEFLNSEGIGVSVFRAPIDNDMYLKKRWKRFSLESERLMPDGKVKHYPDANTYVIEANNKIATDKTKTLMRLKMKYRIDGNGCVAIETECFSSKLIMYVPRFGLTLQMPRRYDNVQYFGRGDRPNLPDFKEHAMLGTYECKVDEMREKYIKPQESAMRSEVRYAEVTDENGDGLRFECSDYHFIFSADHFTSQQCAAAMHQEDLVLCDTTLIHLDAYQLGAGSGACGPIPTKEYKINSLKGVAFSMMMKPVETATFPFSTTATMPLQRK